MAPCSSALSLHSSKDRHKLRKPLVEKMRRDRINSCIEQLKVLLENEFHKQDPNAKLEKADVLEMTVAFLKQQLQPPSPQRHGYSRCWKETLNFLSRDSLKVATPPQLRLLRDAGPTPALSSSHGNIQAAEKQLIGSHGAMWRPW
ncbi:transcription factor HES-5-like [Cheilinus undulatus]|uniref:transcription factor HES-5-like n=1 Tax=Cheilinus undulatus TaxID=241271 RepID=UPI001BD68E29|nr:transcription factor HES-5-like [Cheilinus undulatus]